MKEVILDSEKRRIKAFLNENELEYEDDITNSFYLEENNQIIATISLSHNIIKCLCVRSDYLNNNLTNSLVTHVINYLRTKNIFDYTVITKIVYLDLFISLGFKLIQKTDLTCLLEGGSSDIYKCLEKFKNCIELTFNITLENCNDIGCCVVNCNPFTNGHLALIEHASSKSKYLIVFVLEEDKSYYTFKERFSLVYLGCKHLSNVICLPSSKYIISNLTFPSYFLKSIDQRNREWILMDVMIFKNYFMKYLNIKTRYVGSETIEFMVEYNNCLKENLNLEIIQRVNGISASLVREQTDINKALVYIPNAVKGLFYQIWTEKHKS